MLAFWPDILKPVLAELAPRHIVEIGSESGKVTRLLLDVARPYGGAVTAIDPSPRFDVAAWLREFEPNLRVIQRPSLEVLGALEGLDAVLVDGDHNWYTVHEELHAVEKRAHELGAPMPIVFVHDIGWPYGRRDLYYAPETIPEPHRHPYARRGIHVASADLVERGGINAHLCNALREGGPKNGVLTAVEDYLTETRQAWTLVRIPVAFGLGILVPDWVLPKEPEVARFLALFAEPRLERFLGRLEIARIGSAFGEGVARG